MRRHGLIWAMRSIRKIEIGWTRLTELDPLPKRNVEKTTLQIFAMNSPCPFSFSRARPSLCQRIHFVYRGRGVYFNILQLFCFPSAFLAHKYHKWRISWFLVVANRGWTICASLRCETLAASQTRCSCPIHHCKAGQNLGSDYSFLEPTWTNCSAVISFLQISTGSIVFNTKLRSRVRC